jgi:glucosamine--fructose-6-phosphate aminotransferase (isomerizing)
MGTTPPKERGSYTLSEIRSQADAWEGTMRRIQGEGRLAPLVEEAEEVVFCGCGSAFNIAHAVAPFFQETTCRSCRAAHASDLFLFPQMFLNPRRRTLGVVYSRSGSTTESVRALETLAGRGCKTLGITCFADSPLAAQADVALVLAEAGEKSVTTTRSLTAMVLSGQYLAAVAAGAAGLQEELLGLPQLARSRMAELEELGRQASGDREVEKYAFLGSGPLYGLAREAQLKVKEMVLLPADSYVALDYQHGPMSNVDGGMLVGILVSDAAQPYELALAGHMKSLGGKVLVLCAEAGKFRDRADYLLEVGGGLAEGPRGLLYMPALQFLAYYKAMALGQDPDEPRHLSYFVAAAPEA